MNKSKMTILLALAALFLVGLVVARPLLPVDETRYLSVAWEMHLSGDPFHLTRNFESYAHKPPLLFWVINLIWFFTGISEFGARLVGPGFAILCLWATVRMGRTIWPGQAEQPGGLVLAGFSLFAIYGSAVMFDAMLTLAVVIGATFLWRAGQSEGSWRDWAGLGLALGLGILAKGPVVLLHLVPMMVLIRLWEQGRTPWKRHLQGMILALTTALLVAAVWLVPILLTTDPAFRHELFWTQSMARVQGGMRHDRPFWFLLVLLPLLMFPWGWIPGVWRGLPSAVRADRGMRFLAIWAISAPLLFSLIASKQLHYLLPELPAAALMIGQYLQAGPARRVSFAPWVGLAIAAVVMLAPYSGIPNLPEGMTGPLLLAAGGALALLSVAALRLPLAAGHLILGAGIVAIVHLLAAVSGVFVEFDAQRIVDKLPSSADGVALVGMPYNAEFSFMGRLEGPVAFPEGQTQLLAWAHAHPRGVILGVVGRMPIAAPPQMQLQYNGRLMGFWPAAAIAGN